MGLEQMSLIVMRTFIITAYKHAETLSNPSRGTRLTVIGNYKLSDKWIHIIHTYIQTFTYYISTILKRM